LKAVSDVCQNWQATPIRFSPLHRPPEPRQGLQFWSSAHLI